MTEGIEDHRQLVLRDTDTRIRHAELERDVHVVLGEQPAAERDMSLPGNLRRRELDRVTDQIRDDLT